MASFLKELHAGYSTQTTFYVLDSAQTNEFKAALKRKHRDVKDLKGIVDVHQFYFSVSNAVAKKIVTVEDAAAHAMGVVGTTSNRIEFLYTARNHHCCAVPTLTLVVRAALRSAHTARRASSRTSSTW